MPTPLPTPTLPPGPIFTRVALPSGSVSDRARTLFNVSPPQGVFDWLGVGHEYAPTTGISVPIVWTFQQSTSLVPEFLPIPAAATAGAANRVAVIAGRQVITGTIFEGSEQHGATWTRDDLSDAWDFDATLDAAHRVETNDSSRIQGLDGSDTWGLMLLSVESATDTDDDEDPVTRHHLLMSTDGGSWDALELPGTTVDEHDFVFFVEGERGLVGVSSHDDEAPASTFFTTSDSGTTWQTNNVELLDGQPLAVHDALLRDDEWSPVGSSGTAGKRQAVVVVRRGDGWETEAVQLSPVEEFQGDDLSLIAIEQLGADGLIGIVDTNPGSITVISQNGTSWTQRQDLWLNGDEFNENANLSQLVPDPNEARFLAARGFAAPVWLGTNDVSEIDAPAFDRIGRQREDVIAHNGEFVMISRTSREPFVTQLWRSSDGDSWSRSHLDNDHVPDGPLLGVGESILNWGYDGERPVLRRYDEGRRMSTLNVRPLIAADATDSTTYSKPVIVATNGRSLLATEHRVNDVPGAVVFTFFDPFQSSNLASFEVPSAAGARPLAICPRLDSGEVVVALRISDSVATLLEVWVDEPEPRVGSAAIVGGGDLSNTIMTGCNRLGDGLLMAGVVCSDQAAADGAYNKDECHPSLWTSPDGQLWTEHGDVAQFDGSDMQFLESMASSADGTLVVGTPLDNSDDSTMWLVTADRILQVPTDDIFTLDNFNPGSIAINDNRVVVRTGIDVFAGDLDYLLERTWTETPDEQERTPANTAGDDAGVATPTAVPDAGAAASDSSAPAPIALPPISGPRATVPPSATAVPARPSPASPPAPTSPAATAAPAPTAAPTSEGSVTLTCVTTTDPATGQVTQVCE